MNMKTGFISKLAREGSKVLEKEWLASRPDAVLNDTMIRGLYSCPEVREKAERPATSSS